MGGESTGGDGRHLRLVAKAMLKGTVVPVLGAGANLCDRDEGAPWRPGAGLPSGAELSHLLADEFDCDVADRSDLVRVAQYAEVMTGEGPLYAQLREIFVDDYPLTSLHRFLAAVPSRIAEHGRGSSGQLIVTTNYDDLIERALIEEGVPFDVVRYVAKGARRGLFVHSRPGDADVVISVPNEYDAVDPRLRTVVLKIHGAVDRDDPREDSYVVTEDHYIDYLTRTTPSELIPVHLLNKLVNSHFLFLGYGLRDWNLRVLLHRIWSLRELDWASWAVQDRVDPLDARLWRTREVELHECRLADYVTGLTAAIGDVIA